MTIFVVIPTAADEPLATNIRTMFPSKSHRLPCGEWLVSFVGTSKDLSEALKLTGGIGGQAVVVSISGYHGNAPNDIWEWLKANWTP